jgi:DNA-binding CsgD family transcriptional regulator
MTLTATSSAATKLTDRILGYNTDDLVDVLKEITSEAGLSHISYLQYAKSDETSMLSSIVTYPREWQRHYFLKGYLSIDPVIRHGSRAMLPFDWETLETDEPAVVAFFSDAIRHDLGRRGLSIPVRNRKHTHSLVSFNSNATPNEWESFKRSNMTYLQHLAALIDAAANIDTKLPLGSAASINSKPPDPVRLSQREEQCLIWAARGKTYQEVADIVGVSLGSVKTYLDTARHKLHCINLTHTVAVAVATGLISPGIFKQSLK